MRGPAVQLVIPLTADAPVDDVVATIVGADRADSGDSPELGLASQYLCDTLFGRAVRSFTRDEEGM
jgi:hypothetical protein